VTKRLENANLLAEEKEHSRLQVTRPGKRAFLSNLPFLPERGFHTRGILVKSREKEKRNFAYFSANTAGKDGRLGNLLNP
jgi:hypothetical protein